jgi:hypothetical protein
MTLSFHKYGEFFPGTGAFRDTGIGKGAGWVVLAVFDIVVAAQQRGIQDRGRLTGFWLSQIRGQRPIA